MLAIYLAAVIIPAGPREEPPDPSLAWALPCAQHASKAVTSRGNPQGLGTLGMACQILF